MWGDNTNAVRGGYTAKDIERARRRMKIGTRLRCRTCKACNVDGSKSKLGIERMGTVIAKYPWHAMVQYASGVTESFQWVDLIGKGARR